MRTPDTIPTPHRCPGGCGASVSIERVPVTPNRWKPGGSAAAEKRRVLTAHGELHMCAKPSEAVTLDRVGARGKRHDQRSFARDGSIYAFSRAERRRRWRVVRNAMLFPLAYFEKREFGMCAS